MNKKSDIGLIGLAVMGENLALNMERNGFQVSVYNRAEGAEAGVVEHFMAGRGAGKHFLGFTDLRGLRSQHRASTQDHDDDPCRSSCRSCYRGTASLPL